MAAATCTSAPVPGTSEQFDLGDNNTTSITCIQYVDRTFLSITQGGSFGTLIAASTETHPDGACEVHLRTLLGNREDDFANLAATKIQAANLLVECTPTTSLTVFIKSSMI